MPFSLEANQTHNCVRATISGWGVWWNGHKVADGLTHDAAIIELRKLQTGSK